MRKIKINEAQLIKLIEGNNNTSAPSFKNKFKEFNGAETSTNTTVTEPDGDTTLSEPICTDDFSQVQTPQNYWFQNVRDRRI